MLPESRIIGWKLMMGGGAKMAPSP